MNKFLVEIDRKDLPKVEFDKIKNQLVRKVISDALLVDETKAWYVKVEHDKHIKGSIGVSGMGINKLPPFIEEDFDPQKAINIERMNIELPEF